MGFDAETAANYGNTVLGAACSFASVLPGAAGLLFDVASGVSGAASTATSTTDLDRGINAAGTAGSVIALPAAVAGLFGVGTGVEIGALSTIAGAGGGLGSGAAATGGLAAAAGAASVVGSLVGAGVAGYSLGSLAAAGIDSGNETIFGTRDDGSARSSFDWAADQGHALEGWLGGGTGGLVAGATAAGLLSILSAPVGAAGAVARGIDSMFED